jgi:hypothetical protein
MMDTSAEDQPDPAPEDPLHEHERQLHELHLSIWAQIQRARRVPGWPTPRYATAQPYHPAYNATRVAMLESMVGVLAGLLFTKGVLDPQAFTDKLGEVYIHDLDELRLRGATLNAASFLGGRMRPGTPYDRAGDTAEEVGEEIPEVDEEDWFKRAELNHPKKED